MRPSLAAPLALVLMALACPAFADQDVSDADLESEFRTGLGDELASEGSIDVRRFGRTLIFEGALSGRDDVDPLELTCMLCTADEALQSARTAGATLAERAGTAVDPLDEVPVVAEPRTRPVWVPTLLSGVGLAAAAAGTALLLLDGDCASTTIDAAGHCSRVHDLAPAGWGLVGLGAASVVTGVVLFVLFAGDEEPAGAEP
jgi:hypothetical protein